MGATGDKVKARYTYNYVKEDGIWKIQHHHSSVMPEEIAMGKAITESEVRGLFSLWNNALATLDPKKVASRYAKKGVLLPTVSDTPRTDFASIEDYFKKFCLLKPQGEILESEYAMASTECANVTVLPNVYYPLISANCRLRYHRKELVFGCWYLRGESELENNTRWVCLIVFTDIYFCTSFSCSLPWAPPERR